MSQHSPVSKVTTDGGVTFAIVLATALCFTLGLFVYRRSYWNRTLRSLYLVVSSKGNLTRFYHYAVNNRCKVVLQERDVFGYFNAFSVNVQCSDQVYPTVVTLNAVALFSPGPDQEPDASPIAVESAAALKSASKIVPADRISEQVSALWTAAGSDRKLEPVSTPACEVIYPEFVSYIKGNNSLNMMHEFLNELLSPSLITNDLKSMRILPAKDFFVWLDRTLKHGDHAKLWASLKNLSKHLGWSDRIEPVGFCLGVDLSRHPYLEINDKPFAEYVIANKRIVGRQIIRPIEVFVKPEVTADKV